MKAIWPSMRAERSAETEVNAVPEREVALVPVSFDVELILAAGQLRRIPVRGRQRDDDLRSLGDSSRLQTSTGSVA